MSSGEVLRVSPGGSYDPAAVSITGVYSPARVSFSGIGNVERVCVCCEDGAFDFPFWMFLPSSLPGSMDATPDGLVDDTPIAAPESEPDPPGGRDPLGPGVEIGAPVYGDIGAGGQPGFGDVVVEFVTSGGGGGGHKGAYGQWDFSNNFQSDQALLVWE